MRFEFEMSFRLKQKSMGTPKVYLYLVVFERICWYGTAMHVFTIILLLVYIHKHP